MATPDKTLALANSNCARLPYPYDEATPADRAVLAASEKAAWFLFCLNAPLESTKSLESHPLAEKEGFEPSMELLPAPPLGWYPSGGAKA